MSRGAALWNGSVRWRLTLWYASALTTALVIFGFVLWYSLERRIVAEIDQDLAGRAARFERYFVAESAEKSGGTLTDELEEFCAALPPGSFIELTAQRGQAFRYPDPRPADLASTRILRTSFTYEGKRYDLVAGESLASMLHAIAALRFLLLALTPLAIVFACIGGWLLSRRALKPIADMTEAAKAISIENLSVRLKVPESGDELERLAEVFNSMLGRLESAVETLSQFVADASHELRTPLAVIRTSAEVALRRARSPDAYRESLVGIAAEAERMTTLVEDLLFLARADSAASEPRTETADLSEIAEDAIRSMEHLTEARGIRIVFTPEAHGAAILANPAAVKRMLIALLDNALKNSPDGSEVRVATSLDHEAVSATIQDFGRGIDPDDLPHIFKRFYRADRARSGEGYGLGLSIAESIAGAHGALISVESAPGAGSIFRVRFRIAARVPAQQPGPASGARRSIA